jgi:hypothetical protein
LPDGDDDAQEHTSFLATPGEETSRTGYVMQNQIQPQSQDDKTGAIAKINKEEALDLLTDGDDDAQEKKCISQQQPVKRLVLLGL